MSLAVADLVVGVFVMPIGAVYVLTGDSAASPLRKIKLQIETHPLTFKFRNCET